MRNVYTITDAKARLSELVARLIHRRDTIVLTRKGREVAVIMPFKEYQELGKTQNIALLLLMTVEHHLNRNRGVLIRGK